MQNVYILEGGVNRWIATFGADDAALKPLPDAGPDQLRYAFSAALGNRYKSCSPDPIEHEKLDFRAADRPAAQARQVRWRVRLIGQSRQAGRRVAVATAPYA